jgi:heptosyltransferase-2
MGNLHNNVLVVSQAWIGDIIMSQSLLIQLKKTQKEMNLDVLAPEWAIPLLKRMPEVRNVISLPVRHGELALKKRLAVAKKLKGKYGHAIVLPRSFKSALVPYFANIEKRTGYLGELRYGLLNDIRPHDKKLAPKTILQFKKLGLERQDALADFIIDKPYLKISDKKVQDSLLKFGLDTKKNVVALMPGAEFGPSKRWPPLKFARLATKLNQMGISIWLFGSINDIEIGKEICKASDAPIVDLCGKTTLDEAIDLISCIDLAITNDTGLMHIAAATGRPLISIYGATSPTLYPPITKNAEIMYNGIECSPCMQRLCRYGHYKCLTEINTDEVFEKTINRLSALN